MKVTKVISYLSVLIFASAGCVERESHSSDLMNPSEAIAPERPVSGAIKSLAASEESQADIDIQSYDLYKPAPGVMRVYAADLEGEVRGVLEVSPVGADGGIATRPEDTDAIKIAMIYPIDAARTVAVESGDVDETFPPGSFEQKLAIAIQRDLSNSGSSPSSNYTSSDPFREEKAVSGPGCFTETKCAVVVMTCVDKCCNGWAYDDNGLPKGVDCTTIKKRYVCGACVGFDFF